MDHVKAGAFDSAIRLLNEQIGAINFQPFKSLFLQLYASSRTSYTAVPNLPSLYGYPQRNFKETIPKNGRPAIGVKLNDLVQKLQVSKQNIFLLKFFIDFILCVMVLVSLKFIKIENLKSLV